MMKEKNLVQSTALKIIPIYRQSTGSIAQLFDFNFRHVELDDEPVIDQTICQHCIGFNDSLGCRELHINAIQASGKDGNPSIYQCDLGLQFWACSIFNEGKFSGALRGSGYLSDKIGVFRFTGKCNALCNRTIPPEQFARRVLAFPFGSEAKIQSLAEMLLLCAESLSTGNENHHAKLRTSFVRHSSLSSQVEELKLKYPQGSALPGYPLDKERQLIMHLRRGNKDEAGRILDEVLAILMVNNPSHFKYIQLRALELAVLFARCGTNSGSSLAMEYNARDIKHIQEAKTAEELALVLHGIVDRISLQIISFQGLPHASAMRKAEHFIRGNFSRKISLSEIAGIAGLSAPYFSTIFKEEMGENLSRYINRLRVEKASKMLLETNFSLSEIAGECCFEDQSWFSKIFKSFTGISPGRYRSQGGSIAASCS